MQILARKKKILASKGFEPMVYAFTQQCSTNWAMKTIFWAGQFIELILTRDRDETLNESDYELREYRWNEDVIIAVVIAI